jgi:hypothetical protein
MNALEFIVQVGTVAAALFVLVRSVCILNIMTRETPHFVFALYLADAAGAMLVLMLPIIECRVQTIAESVFVVGCAIAFLFDRRRAQQIHDDIKRLSV